MTRRKIREQIFSILFRIEFYPKEELTEQLQYISEDLDAADPDAVYIQNKILAVADRVEEIDGMINGHH